MTPLERSNFVKQQLQEFIESLQGDDVFITGCDFQGETELIDVSRPDMTTRYKTGKHLVNLSVTYIRK